MDGKRAQVGCRKQVFKQDMHIVRREALHVLIHSSTGPARTKEAPLFACWPTLPRIFKPQVSFKKGAEGDLTQTEEKEAL